MFRLNYYKNPITFGNLIIMLTWALRVVDEKNHEFVPSRIAFTTHIQDESD